MEKISYEWIRSKRKTIAIQVKQDGSVIVRSPYFVSQKQVEIFLNDKQEWIQKQLEKIENVKKEQIQITAEERERGVELALKLIPERVEYFASKMGVTYSRITIREQKTRWGSCSSKGNLNFNWKLVLMPREVLDYVVVHELAHRKEMNHSPKFWKVVEDAMPDYKARKQWLKENGKLLVMSE